MNNVAQELLKIAKNGKLRPVDVVTASKPVAAPLHDKFEWNNAKAGHEYRLWQARQLITVNIEYLPSSDDSYQVFVSLSSDRKEQGGGYRPLTTVLADKDMRAQLLADACAEMERFQQKYAMLKELAGVFDAMKQFKRKKIAA